MKDDELIYEQDGILRSFPVYEDLFMGERNCRRLRAELGWFEKLINHAPSIGTFYEDSLRAILAEEIPAKFKIGTGFIFDPQTRRHTKQLDILIYNDSEAPPLYKRGNFVIITPDMAISQSEVKKTLTLKDTRNLINSVFYSNFGQARSDICGYGELLIFCYSSNSKIEKIIETIHTEISKIARHSFVKNTDGKELYNNIYNIVLCNFYFFDRNIFIRCMLEKNKEGNFIVKIFGVNYSFDNSLNDYIESMSRYSKNSNSYFRLPPFRRVILQRTVECPIRLRRQIAMAQLLEIYRNEADLVRSFLYDDQKPYKVDVPADFDLFKTRSFRDLCGSDDIQWFV